MIRISACLLLAGLTPAMAQDISLEDLLRQAKEAQNQTQGSFREQVNLALVQLEAPGLRDNALRSIAHNLAKLGPAAGPLLVPGLNPGEGLPAPYRTRSNRVLVVLQSFDDLGTTLALLKTIEHAAGPGHALAALKALRHSPHRRFVADALLPTIAQGKDNPLAVPALTTLSALAGEEAGLWLRDCAERQDASGETQALQALTVAHNPHTAQLVLDNLLRPGRSALHQYEALTHGLGYFASVPELLAGQDTFRGPLMRLAKDVPAAIGEVVPDKRPAHGRSLLLQTLLGTPNIKLSGELKRELWLWLDQYSQDKKQILALLAKGGDSKAKRQFLQNHNTRIKALRKIGGQQLAKALLKRGTAFQLIADFRSAQRDAERGIKVFHELRNGGGYPEANKLRILAARAAASSGKFRAAADFLKKANLSSKKAAELGADPVFREFLDSRYGEILRP